MMPERLPEKGWLAVRFAGRQSPPAGFARATKEPIKLFLVWLGSAWIGPSLIGDQRR